MLEPMDTPTSPRSGQLEELLHFDSYSFASVTDLCDWLDERIRAGFELRCEYLLQRFPEWFTDVDAALDLVYAEYSARCESGAPPTPEEFYQRFPQWRSQLEHQFELTKLFDQPSPTVNAIDSLSSPPATSSRYRVIKLLARGGIGQVMQAVDTELNREVAVKEIQAQLAQNLSVRERFLREAEITGQLEHPGIVPVYGLGCDENQLPFYAMRLVRGQSLLEAIHDFHGSARMGDYRSLPFQNLLRRFLSVCETISYAHSRGVIHRDIKPENILLGPFGETLIVDWGLAKVTSSDAAHSLAPHTHQEHVDGEHSPETTSCDMDPTGWTSGHSPANWSVALTQSVGTLVGTPAYMSPEQAQGDVTAITPLSDVYSLGATLHMLLTGRPRLETSDLGSALRAILSGDWLPPRAMNRRVPRGLDAICMKALRLAPADRYASAAEMARDIEHYLADEPTTALSESALGRVMRMTRRNRTLAFSAVVSMMILTIITFVSAMRINVAKRQADLAFVEAERGNARLAFDRGYELLDSHQFGEGWLWLQRALTHVPKNDQPMRRVILTNMAAARSHLLFRQAIFNNQENLALFQFDPQGRQLVTVSRTGLVRYWNADNGTRLFEQQLPSKRMLAVDIDANGSTHIITSSGRVLSAYTLSPSQSPVKIWEEEQPGAIHAVTVQADGQQAAVSLRSNTGWSVRVFDVRDGHALANIPIASPSQIIFDEANQQLYCVHENSSASIWKWHADTSDYRLTGTLENVYRMTVSPDGKWLMVGTAQGSVLCYASKTLTLHSVVGQHAGRVVALAVSPDGQILVAAWDNGVARSWNLKDRQPACETLRVDRYTSRILFRPHTRQLALLTKPHIVNLWQLPESNQTSHQLPIRNMESIEYSRDGAIAVVASRDRFAQILDGVTGQALHTPMPHQDVIKSVCLHPNGQLALTASFDGTAILWNTTDGSQADVQLHYATSSETPSKQASRINFATFSPDGRLVATAENSGAVKLWDVASGAHLRTLKVSRSAALKVCFSPDSQQLLAGHNSPECCVRMWDVESGQLQWTGQHKGAVRCVAISPNGRFAVSGGNDTTARLWDTTTGEALGSDLPGRGEIFVARFHPSSTMVATGGYDATIRLWRVPSGQLVGEPMLHEALVTDLVFDAEGSRLLSGSVDETARLWDVDTCLPLSPPLLHAGPLISVAMHPHANSALTGRLWQLPSALPDDPELIHLLTRLATQRAFTSGHNIDWLKPEELLNDSDQFMQKAGCTWQQWPLR